jgi:phosphatidylglycerophosphate synthase
VNRHTAIVSAVVWSRAATAPVIGILAATGHSRAAAVLLVAAVASDWLDGVLARRWHTGPAGGAYADPLADLAVVVAATIGFATAGPLPWWVLAIEAGMFTQFVLTSTPGRPVYDPIGKHYGTMLYLTLTALAAAPATTSAVAPWIIGIYTVMSIGSRITALTQPTSPTSRPMATPATPAVAASRPGT